MAKELPTWKPLPGGGKILRLYKTSLNPDYPEIVIMDLPAKTFRQFEDDPIGFDKKNKLFPNRLRWISSCEKPPRGENGPKPNPNVQWRLVILHCKESIAVCAASPHRAA